MSDQITLNFKLTLNPKGSADISEYGIDKVAEEILRRLNQSIKPNIIVANPGVFCEITDIEEI